MHLSSDQAGTLQNLWEPWTQAIAQRCEQPAEAFVRDILLGADTVHLIWDDDRAELRGVVITTFVVDDDGRKHCHLPYCTGEGMSDWFWLLASLEDWAREQGAVSVKSIARKGWTRLMTPLGYRATHVVLEKDL